MLTAKAIHGFVETFLLKNYDNPTPVPRFHDELWELCCRKDQRVAIAAPRGHAKSTAITHAFVLAKTLFREAKYVIIVSDTEGQAILFLESLKIELLENADIIEVFGVDRLTKDSATEIIVRMNDGHKFRIQAKGAKQKVRGRKAGHQRPDLIVVDDLENDELVENEERRSDLRDWFMRALLPSLSRNGQMRMVGTILHLDSLLYRLIHNESWVGILYKAHESFDDFSNLLWPEYWTEELLKAHRQNYIEDGNPEGYSQEYLNNPIDQAKAYFRKEDLIAMEEHDYIAPGNYYAGMDLAISDQDKRAYNVIVIGKLIHTGILLIVDVLRFRGDGDEIINNILNFQVKYDIDMWNIEKGQISMSLESQLISTALQRNISLPYKLAVPVKDKRSRARSIQARMRMGGVRIDKNASWYPSFEEELIYFPKGGYKDQVDALAWLGLAINEMAEGYTKEELEQDEYEEEIRFFTRTGSNKYTGY